MNKLASINGLRGFAILAVIQYHSFFDSFKYGTEENRYPLALDILMSSGWLGVNLFFILSGFVLYLPFARGDRRMGSWADARDFYRRRWLRLIPLYTFVWILSLVFVSGLQPDSRDFWIAVMGYVTCLFPFHPDSFSPPGNWVMWSLGVEIWFSVLFPLLVLAIQRFGIARFFAAVLVLSHLVRFAGQWLTPAPPGMILNFVSDGFIGRLDELGYGMLGAHLYAQGRHFPRWVLMPAAIAIAASLVMWFAWYGGQLPLIWTPLALTVLDFGMFLLMMASIASPSVFTRWLSWPWLQLLGMMCYSLYLWHGIVQIKLGATFTDGPIEYAAYIGTVFGLSWLTYRYIEFRKVRTMRELLPDAWR